MEPAELEFRDVVERYPGAERPAVDHLSLTVPAGDICVLVGPSGCGKTTAMRMVNRMIDITEGDIFLGGRSVRQTDPVRLRREIGYVIQQIGLFPHATIGDNIATVPRLLGWEKQRVRARVDELLERRIESQCGGDQPVGEPGVLRQQRAVQVGANDVAMTGPLEAILAIVAVSAEGPA